MQNVLELQLASAFLLMLSLQFLYEHWVCVLCLQVTKYLCCSSWSAQKSFRAQLEVVDFA